MNQKEIEVYFQNIGEIWRDVTALEFLMRSSIMYKDGDAHKFPKPPYDKGKIYEIYPKSFQNLSFENIVIKFNKRYPNICIPKELIELRNAMAHGLIAQIGEGNVNQLFKFREYKSEDKDKKNLMVEFSMVLDIEKTNSLKLELCNLRRFVLIQLQEIAQKDSSK